MRKVIILMIVALFAVSFALAACGQKADEPKDQGKVVEQPENKDAAEEKIENDMKEVAFAEYKSFGSQLLYRIELVEFANQYVFATLPTEAGPGNIFVKVTVGAKNDTNDVVKVSSLLFDAKIYDPKGTEYTSETFNDDALEGDVAAGEEKSGVFFFKVPGDGNLDLAGWTLKMKTDDILSDKMVEMPLQ